MENKTKQSISFDNLKALSAIKRTNLPELNNDVQAILDKLGNLSKNVRGHINSKKEANKVPSFSVEKAKQPQQEKKPANSPKQESQTQVKFFGPKNQDKKPYQPKDRNQSKPPFTSRRSDGASKPFNQKDDYGQKPFSRPKKEENYVDFSATNSRDFSGSKKIDNEKRGRVSYDKKPSKKPLRQISQEEGNKEERIRGSRKIKKQKAQEVVVAAPIDHLVITTEDITIKQLSEKTGRSVAEILKPLMTLGIVANINSSIDFATAELVCGELGVVLEQQLEKSFEEKLAEEFASEEEMAKNTETKPPIVAVLGHVDHGKTSLLDYIRKSHIASGEAGGITQHISAYQIETKNKKITFIDTPGHEAFSAMRERGANVTNLAILVVAGDDGIKPQTVEAIKHIKNAKVPMIVAVNKMDKPEFNLDRVKQQLTEHDIVPEEWGGDAIIVPISALTGQGIDKLLEMILLVADMQELKANPNANALGMIIESKLDKGMGPVARTIILNGTLKVGDTIISGIHTGKVRALINDKGENIKKAGPSTPVSVLGLDGVPNVGDNLYAVDEKLIKQVLAERKRKVQTEKINAKSKFSVEDFLSKNVDEEKKVLNVVVKADVQGSFEAAVDALNKLQNDEVRVECIHGGVGPINENDVLLAKSADAMLVGFNVKPDSKAQIIIEHNKMPIFMSKIIYQIIEHITKVIKSMRKPVFEERVIGHAEVIRIFKISRIGTVAGCVVKDGKITKSAKIRLFRGKEMLVDTTITTLQKDKNDVKDVVANMECGIKLEGHNDILVGDLVEAYVIEQIERD